jgi:hypothetical protein
LQSRFAIRKLLNISPTLGGKEFFGVYFTNDFSAMEIQNGSITSLIYVIDTGIGSTGFRGRTRGLPVYTLRLYSDAGYADLP